MAKLLHVIREELVGFNFRFLVAYFLLKFIPSFVGGRLRVKILRLAGFCIGDKSMIMGKPRIIGGRNIIKNLTIGPYAFINVDCFFDLAAPINIGQEVGIGPQTMLITGAHEIADEDKRVGALEPRAITIGDGVWLGARCIILPGVSVGHGAVVAAGAIVTKDVPANVLVAGVPARVIKELPSSGDRPFSSNDQSVLWVEDNVQLSLNAVSSNEFPNRD